MKPQKSPEVLGIEEADLEDKKTFSEDYSDIQCNALVDPGTFDPKQFSSTH